MDKPSPQSLDRTELKSFLGDNPRLIRAFEEFIRWLADLTPDEISSLQFDVAAVRAAVIDLAEAMARAADDNQAAQAAVLSGQVEHLREQLAAVPDLTAELVSLRAEIANLRENAQMGQRIRRIEQQVINIGSGSLANTFNITPPLLGPTEMRFLGCNSDDVDSDGASVSITRAGSVVTATRNATGFATRAVFEFTEYYP